MTVRSEDEEVSAEIVTAKTSDGNGRGGFLRRSIRGTIDKGKKVSGGVIDKVSTTVDPMMPAQVKYSVAVAKAMSNGLGDVILSAKNALLTLKNNCVNVCTTIKSVQSDVRACMTSSVKGVNRNGRKIFDAFKRTGIDLSVNVGQTYKDTMAMIFKYRTCD